MIEHARAEGHGLQFRSAELEGCCFAGTSNDHAPLRLLVDFSTHLCSGMPV